MIDIDKENLDRILSILNKYLAEYDVWAFGSRIKGTARKYSDLDLVIISDVEIDLQKLTEVKEAFAESDIPFRIDILDWSSISENFKRVIEKNYVILKSVNSK